MTIGITLIIFGLIFTLIGFTRYVEWEGKRQFWEEEKNQIYNEWQKNPENEAEMEYYLDLASAASHAEEKVMEYLRILLIGASLLISGLILFMYSIKVKIQLLFKDPRISTTLKFSMAVISIVCAIFLISMIFFQFTSAGYYNSVDGYNDTELTTFRPEIFIPEGLILLMLGSITLYILREQVRNEEKNKRINSISLGLSICILLYIALFVFGFIILSLLAKGYTILDPLFGLIAAPLIFCASIYLFYYINKTKHDEPNNTLEKDETSQTKLVEEYGKYNINLVTNSMYIFIFFAFLLSGFIKPYNYIYKWVIFSPPWGLVIGFSLIVIFAYLPFHVNIIINDSKLFRKHFKAQLRVKIGSRRLLDDNSINFKLITIILITLAFLSFFFFFTLDNVTIRGASIDLNDKMWDLATTFYIAWLVISIFYLRNEQQKWSETNKDLQIFPRVSNLDPNKSELRIP
jgi:MFS family permease